MTSLSVQMIKYLKSQQDFDKSQKYQLFTINRYIYIKVKNICVI